MNHPAVKSAFSLVELSIVLVILGLLTGGILAGKSMIRASELRSVASDYSRYRTATAAFKDKYFGLPGDITNAVSIWGSADGSAGNTSSCYDVNSTDAKTCNGNGDSFINSSLSPSVSNGGSWYYAHESLRFWQHLVNAGLLEGQYTGNGNPSGTVSGTNTPASKVEVALDILYRQLIQQ